MLLSRCCRIDIRAEGGLNQALTQFFAGFTVSHRYRHGHFGRRPLYMLLACARRVAHARKILIALAGVSDIMAG